MPQPTQAPPVQVLARKIADRTATVAVLGLGYVGLPLARALHDAGFRMVGFDRDASKVDKLRRGEGYLAHLGDDFTAPLAASERFVATSDPAALAEADALILCVPSPIGEHDEPDLSHILEATRLVADVLRPGQLVCLESTTYPGTTRGDCLPLLAATGLEPGVEFFLAFSPEREDPGRKDHGTKTIPKLVGGVDEASTGLAATLYATAVREVVPVDSAEVAEAAKLLENIYRCVNIALVNELKPLLTDMGIDVWNVIGAASTKPFGFAPFWPGPGLGGHCIPIDPFYLTWKAKELGHRTRFIELAGAVNSSMPGYVTRRVAEALNDAGRSVRGARVLLLGVTYKPDVDDTRETPAAALLEQLARRGAEVRFHDPHVADYPEMARHGFATASTALDEQALQDVDCVVVVTDHVAIDWDLVARAAPLTVDTRNRLATYVCSGRVFKA